MRSVQTAGALEAILSLSVAYANERVAFERPIGKFQAVQQNLARLAGEIAAALAAAGSAADTIAQAPVRRRRFARSGLRENPLRRSRSGRLDHRASGLRRNRLHQRTCIASIHASRLSWRDDFGNESYWAAELGKQIARRGADEFWPLVASR